MIADAPLPNETDPESLSLDPFSYLPHISSGIAGLNDTDDTDDTSYAFHTHYSKINGPWARFDLLFDNLVVSEGIMIVQINRIDDNPGAIPKLVTSKSLVLADLLPCGGRFSVDFPVEEDSHYAAYGRLATPTDAYADRLTIGLQGGLSAPPTPDLPDVTAYGHSSMQSARRLVAERPPTLAFPVSQVMTQSQLREPVYRHWIEEMGLDGVDAHTGWKLVFAMQALSRYGMLEKHAYGLGLGVEGEPLPALMASLGCRMTITPMPTVNPTGNSEVEIAAWRDSLRFPEICSDDVFQHAVDYHDGIDQGALQDTSFDFCWSTGLQPRFQDGKSDIAFFGESLRYVKPGGLAVHLLDLGTDSEAICRQDIERLALLLVSHGNLVAQLNFHSDDGRRFPKIASHQTIPFALILQRNGNS